MLDGGWAAWRADGGEVETGRPRRRRATSRPGPGTMPVVEADGVLDVPVLVDARAPERYRGETEPIDPVAGRIPGAVNVPTSANLGADGRFRSPDQLRALYEAAGVPLDGTEVAVYCGSGVTAIHDLIALELLGVRAALYPGSWCGWITDPAARSSRSAPVRKGTVQSTQIVLSSRPVGEPRPRDFGTVSVDLPPLEDGQVLLRVRYLSLDPYMRGRMSEAESYADPVELGEVMVGGTVCEVVESRSPSRAVGDLVLSYSGWQTHAVADARATRRLDPDAAPVSTALGVLGMPGFTAYAGLLEIGGRAPARPSSSPPPPVRSAPRSGRSPRSRAPGRWGSPAGPRSAGP